MDDEVGYAEFVRDRWRDLVRAAVFLGASQSEAEDLAQQTLIRCYAHWRRVTGADNVDAYVYRILVNQLRDSRRSSWWRLRADGDADREVTDSSDAVATVDAVHRALAALSKANRDVVVLRYFVQLTEEQTATALHIPRGTVKSRLSRALATLAASDHLTDLAEERVHD